MKVVEHHKKTQRKRLEEIWSTEITEKEKNIREGAISSLRQ